MAAQSDYRPRILCTEDHADTCDLLAFVLNLAGYEVICSSNPEDALSHARSESFDLFIVDTWLPGMSGIELTKKLRHLKIKTPVLFYTGCGFPKDKAEAREAGASGYLVKPVESDDLVSEVARLISVRQAA